MPPKEGGGGGGYLCKVPNTLSKATKYLTGDPNVPLYKLIAVINLLATREVISASE